MSAPASVVTLRATMVHQRERSNPAQQGKQPEDVFRFPKCELENLDHDEEPERCPLFEVEAVAEPSNGPVQNIDRKHRLVEPHRSAREELGEAEYHACADDGYREKVHPRHSI